MGDAKLGETFLATTALEEFWDTSKPIIFLGEWCLLYERRSYWEKLNGRLLTNIFENPDANEDAHRYINHIYEQILPSLAATLNSIHGKNHSVHYWRILIGPWLQSYISVSYDRFVHIKHALDQYPGLTTIGLSQESFVVPTDSLEYFCMVFDDSYNLQLFTKIMNSLGKKFPSKKIALSGNSLYYRFAGDSWVRKALCKAVKIFAGFGEKSSKLLLLKNSYFSKRVELQLITRNLGRFLPSWNQMNVSSRFEYNNEKRDALRVVEIGEGEFERCLSAMLFSDIPQSFVEGFVALEKASRESYPRITKAIFSANSWHCDETFKHWAAMSAEEGTLLLGTQHGGNYGALSHVPSENHETAIVDRYYSWGWVRTDCKAIVIPMPATKLVGRKKIGADNSKKGILWVATSVPRYADAFQSLFPTHFGEYLTWQTRFAKALPQELVTEISFRPHYENYSWGTVERMKDCVPNIQVESWDIPFQKRLESCRLYVCDHLSTTYTESLAANKPTVLFWNPASNRLRPEAQKPFDALMNVGLLFVSPEAAASAVAEIYNDVETWWNTPERQKAIRAFCEQFARNSSNAIELWNNELKRVHDLS